MAPNTTAGILGLGLYATVAGGVPVYDGLSQKRGAAKTACLKGKSRPSLNHGKNGGRSHNRKKSR